MISVPEDIIVSLRVIKSVYFSPSNYFQNEKAALSQAGGQFMYSDQSSR